MFSLAAVGVLMNAATMLAEPRAGWVTELTTSSGSSFTCVYTGRYMNCHSDIDVDDLAPDDGGLNEDDLGCHQVAYRSPYHLRTGYDCIDEATWDHLEIGDYYQTRR